MDPVIFVEVLGSRGRVAQRVRLDALPATVGRGYGNAVILDDRYVSPEHARIALAPDGGLVVEDLGSTNGVFAETGTERVASLRLAPGAIFRVGHTFLRVATADQAVIPAQPDPLAGAWASQRGAGRRLGTAIVAALGLSMVSSYLGSYGETSAAALLVDALSLGAGLLAWAGAWALVTRVTAQRFAFGQHLAVATTVLLAAEALSMVASVGDLIETGTPFYRAAVTVLFVLALAALLFGHLGVAAPLPARRRLAWSLGLAGAIVGLDEFTDFAAGGRFERAPSFVGAVRPLAGARGTSLDAFIAAAAELQRKVDAQADERER